MVSALLIPLIDDELKDLIAYLKAGGNQDSPIYKEKK